MSQIRYQRDSNGLRGFLLSQEVRDLCTARAALGAAFIQATAPVGSPPADPHPGQYREAVRVEQAGVGGRQHDRVAVAVVVDVPYAAALEVQYGHHTLLRAIPVIEGRL